MDWMRVLELVGPPAASIAVVIILFGAAARSAMKFYAEQTAGWQTFIVSQGEEWRTFTGNHLSGTTANLEHITKTLEHLCDRQERIDNLVTGCPRRRKTDLNGDE